MPPTLPPRRDHPTKPRPQRTGPGTAAIPLGPTPIRRAQARPPRRSDSSSSTRRRPTGA